MRWSRAQEIAEWLLLIAFTGALFLHTLPKAWKTLNTDFPNYYLASRLAHEGIDTSRANEWVWLQRQKDYRSIDEPVIGLVPITPFSTLAVWPLDGLPPLVAKHRWLCLQMALLLFAGFAIRAITGQPLRRIALLAVISFPLHRNFLYGQFYILLLALIVAACWAYQLRRSALAGSLIALAAACKVFPIVFLLYFVRKRNWRALGAALLTGVIAIAISIFFFGWNMHRTYLLEVLPWTLRGEHLPPYVLSASSLSALLHRLFVYEPQWNPHPWHNAPILFSILQPLLQMLLLAPALLLIRPGARDRTAIALEWSALLSASVAISTSPASYLFTLLIFPMAVLCARFLPERRIVALGVFLLYLGIGFPVWNTSPADGLRAVLHIPRLWLVIAFLAVLYGAIGVRVLGSRKLRTDNLLWCIALMVAVGVNIAGGLRRLHGLYADYAYRLPMPNDVLSAAYPIDDHGVISSVSLMESGYRVVSNRQTAVASSAGKSQRDELSQSSNGMDTWIEQVSEQSRIASVHNAGFHAIEDAHAPVLSPNGRHIAYLREVQGRDRLFVRDFDRFDSSEIAFTPSWMNVEGETFLPEGSLIVAAFANNGPLQLFLVRAGAQPQPMNLGEVRDPAISPDGRWLAYSRFQSGVWNLWLYDRTLELSHPLAHVACNQVQASWEADSKTLLYASDCGRAMWFTAICRRRVIP